MPIEFQIVLTISAFLFGSAIGSFLSVVIYRIHSGEKGILMGRSNCPKCKNKLMPQDLVPIFSWLFLRGKCRRCKTKISAIYPALELVTATLWALAFWQFGLSWQLPLYLLLFTLFVAIFFYDLLFMEIPDRFSLTGIVIALIISLIYGTPEISNALIGGLIGAGFFLAQFLISKGKWVGGGDVRLGAMMGAALGWQLNLVAIFFAYIIGTFFAAYLLYIKKVGKNYEMAFGPHLITGFFIAFYFGESILKWYLGI